MATLNDVLKVLGVEKIVRTINTNHLLPISNKLFMGEIDEEKAYNLAKGAFSKVYNTDISCDTPTNRCDYVIVKVGDVEIGYTPETCRISRQEPVLKMVGPAQVSGCAEHLEGIAESLGAEVEFADGSIIGGICDHGPIGPELPKQFAELGAAMLAYSYNDTFRWNEGVPPKETGMSARLPTGTFWPVRIGGEKIIYDRKGIVLVGPHHVKEDADRNAFVVNGNRYQPY